MSALQHHLKDTVNIWQVPHHLVQLGSDQLELVFSSCAGGSQCIMQVSASVHHAINLMQAPLRWINKALDCLAVQSVT